MLQNSTIRDFLSYIIDNTQVFFRHQTAHRICRYYEDTPNMIDSTQVIPLPLINGLKVILVNSSLITIRFKFLAHLFAIKGGFYLYHSIIWALNF